MVSFRSCCAIAVSLVVLAGAGCSADDSEPESQAGPAPTATSSAGTPRASSSPSRTSTPTPTAPTTTSTPAKQAGPYRTGDCLTFEGSAYKKVGCEQEHYVEVTMSDRVPAGAKPPEDFPPEDPKVSPICEAALTPYLGSPDSDATRLEHRAIWPTAVQWKAGQRWFACTVVERDPRNEAGAWKGSRAGVLRNGLGTLRRCMVGEPLDEPARVVPCAQAHRSEAVEGVVPLGSHTEPAPSYQTMLNRSLDRCAPAVRAYLGGKRSGVSELTVLPDREFWPFGATNAICYAVSKKPVTGPMGHL